MRLPTQLIFVILTYLVVYSQAGCKKDFWNEILYYEGILQEKDYVIQKIGQTNSQRGSNDSPKDPFCLQVFSNRTFVFQIDYSDGTPSLLVTGKTTEQQRRNSIYLFNLIASERENTFKGQIISNYTRDCSWFYELDISDKGILLKRQVEGSGWYFQIAKIILVIIMLVLLPITEKRRARMLYDIRVRSSIITLFAIMSKVTFLITMLFMQEGFLLRYYGSSKDNRLSASSILKALAILHLIIIFLLPLVMHMAYMISVILKCLQNSQKFKQKSELSRASMIILPVTIAIAICIFITKGLLFHYIFSLSIIPTLIHSARVKKYIYGRSIVFDLLLNFSTILFGLYLPVYDFSLISYRQAALLLNFQFGLLVFGLIITKRIIATEPEQPITTEQLTCQMSLWTKHQPLQQADNRGTIQIIE